MRLDKWLWAARFFKTRGIANAAIDSGKVKLNGYAAKPSKNVKPGDRLQVRAGGQLWEVDVLALNEQRRPAVEAQQLYAETPGSAQARARQAELSRLAPTQLPERKGRPTKRERRQLESFRKAP